MCMTSSRRQSMWIALCAVALSLACMPKTSVAPLRREDPRVLEMIGAEKGWLNETGATRAAKALWRALRERDFAASLERLGPLTRRVLAGEAGSKVLNPSALKGLLEQGGQRSKGIASVLRKLSEIANPTFRERSAFDPTKRRAEVLVLGSTQKDSLRLVAVFTDSGWKLELVSPSGRYGDGSVERR